MTYTVPFIGNLIPKPSCFTCEGFIFLQQICHQSIFIILKAIIIQSMLQMATPIHTIIMKYCFYNAQLGKLCNLNHGSRHNTMKSDPRKLSHKLESFVHVSLQNLKLWHVTLPWFKIVNQNYHYFLQLRGVKVP